MSAKTSKSTEALIRRMFRRGVSVKLICAQARVSGPTVRRVLGIDVHERLGQLVEPYWCKGCGRLVNRRPCHTCWVEHERQAWERSGRPAPDEKADDEQVPYLPTPEEIEAQCLAIRTGATRVESSEAKARFKKCNVAGWRDMG